MKGKIYMKAKGIRNWWPVELKEKIGVCIILIALFLFSHGCSTKPDNDLIGMKKVALEKLLGTTPDSPLKVDILNELAYRESWNGGPEGQKHVDSAIALAEKMNYRKGLVDAWCISSQFYFLKGNFDKSKEFRKKGIELAESINYNTGKAMAYNGIARFQQIRGEYAKALKNFLKSEAICKNSSDKKDQRALAVAYYGLGALYYYDPEDYKEARSCFERYLKLGNEINDEIIKTSGYYTIGVQYQSLGKYKKAEENLMECLALSKEIGLIYNQANAYECMGDMYFDQNEKTKAEENFIKSRDLFSQTGNEFQIAEINKRLGKLYNRKGEYKKAIGYLEEALKFAQAADIPKTITTTCEEMVKSQEGLGDYKPASDYYKILLDKKEFLRKNEMLKQKLILDFEQSAKEERIKRTSLIMGLIGLSIALLVVLGFSLTLRKQKKKIEDQAKRLEEALRKEKELSDHKDDLMKTVSHQYKTPLANINSSVQVLRDYLPKLAPQEIENHFNRILSNLDRMAHLIDQLLKFGKIFCPADYDLDRICRDLIEELKSNEGSKHNIEFISSGDCGKIKVDKDYLEIILQNLVNNSIKFSPEGSKISVELSCDKESAVIKVSDNGIGIPEDYLKMPFKRYHRGSNVGAVQGTGLGLAIVKRYTDLHCGDISIDTKLNAGTTVTLKIPRIACEKKGVSHE